MLSYVRDRKNGQIRQSRSIMKDSWTMTLDKHRAVDEWGRLKDVYKNSDHRGKNWSDIVMIG